MTNIKFLDGYKLTAGIHTISIQTEEQANAELKKTSAAVKSIKYNKQTKKTNIILNLNKIDGFIYSYDEFVEKLSTVLEELGIDACKIIRVDMCFDSYDAEHYHKYAKLNRLIISMFAQAYSIDNRYRTNDLFTNKQLSIAVKLPNAFQIENYDKERESKGKDIAKSRFEIRSLRMADKAIEEEFITVWNERFENTYKYYFETLARYNNELVKIYKAEHERGNPVKWSTFFQMYENCIFTREQAINLLSMMGETSCEEKYKYFKKKYKLETYSKTMVSAAVREILRARNTYFYGG